jgi:hypothetical protein
MHQKHPPAKIAVATFSGGTGGVSFSWAAAFTGGADSCAGKLSVFDELVLRHPIVLAASSAIEAQRMAARLI